MTALEYKERSQLEVVPPSVLSVLLATKNNLPHVWIKVEIWEQISAGGKSAFIGHAFSVVNSGDFIIDKETGLFINPQSEEEKQANYFTSIEEAIDCFNKHYRG